MRVFGILILTISAYLFAFAGISMAVEPTKGSVKAASSHFVNNIGWASQTGFRNAETRVQKAIVSKALGAVGRSSGQSVTSSSGWLTDTADGDGARMRRAIEIYAGWVYAQPSQYNLTQIKARMNSAFSGSAYDSLRRQKLVDRIVEVVNAAVRRNAYRAPRNDNETLTLLGVRAQCLEWAMTTAISSGGLAKGYNAAGVSNPTEFRPGMGLYKNDRSHSMIIVDIRWDARGNPVEFKVAESNFKAGSTGSWINPAGAAPWERTVTVRSGLSLSGLKVIDFERR